jgi:hypothetical protein
MLAQEYNPILRHILRDDLPPSSNPHILQLQRELFLAVDHYHPNYEVLPTRCGQLSIGTCFMMFPRLAAARRPRWPHRLAAIRLSRWIPRLIQKIGKAVLEKRTRRQAQWRATHWRWPLRAKAEVLDEDVESIYDNYLRWFKSTYNLGRLPPQLLGLPRNWNINNPDTPSTDWHMWKRNHDWG